MRHALYVKCSLLVVLLGLVAWGGSWYGREALIDKAGNDGLQIAAADLDLGEVWAVDRYLWKLDIYNSGDSTKRIIDTAVSCNCVTISPRTLELFPGETGRLDVLLDLSLPDDSDGWSDLTPFEATVVPVMDQGMARQMGWTIRGQLRRPFRISPPVSKLFVTSVNQSESEPLILKVAVARGLRDFAVFTDRDEASDVMIDCEALADSESEFRVSIQIPRSQPVGEFSFPVTFEAVEGDRTIVTTHRIRGEILHPVALFPPEAAFGIMDIGSEKEIIVVAQSRTDRGFVLNPKSGSSDDVKADILRSSGTEAAIAIRCCASKGGTHADRLGFSVSSTKGERLPDLQIPITYIGTINEKSRR